MIIPIELRFKADKDSKSAFRTDKTIKSHDINTVEFHISIDGLELTDNHTAKILSIFHSSKSQANVDCEIVDGKIIYKPDTKLISRYEHVTSYVYVYHNNQSLDVCEFTYIVDLSKIDETSLKVKEVYDQSYADLLADFEQALNDYKDNLPQADSVRADIDEILNQFSVDSQAKLSQYNTDAQQVITDNQTVFDLAESGRQEDFDTSQSARQESYEQTQSLINEAEQSRAQAEGQRESAESSRASAEAKRAQAESERENTEGSREQSEGERKANEEVRELAENERESSEAQRKTDHANRSAEFEGKADRVVMNNIIPNGNFKTDFNPWIGNLADVSINDNKLMVTADGRGPLPNVVLNHSFRPTNYTKTFYYGYAKAKAKNDSVNTLSFYMNSNGSTRGLSSVSKPTKDEEYLLSGVLETPDSWKDESVGIYFSHTYSSIIESTGKSIEVWDIIVIDLTQTFGAGNEPTKEEMDELIKVTGYIDREYALNNKEMLIWTLALIRRNKNAIVTLGGA